MKQTISIDIDETIRNLSFQIEKYLEIDHPNLLDKYLETRGEQFNSLDKLFPSKEDFLVWMYDERVFQLFGMAPRTHPKVIDDINHFALSLEDSEYEVWLSSVQRDRSITATLFWLGKFGCRIKNYKFFNTMKEKIDHGFDIYVDDCPEVLANTNYMSIKVPYKYNESINAPTLDIVNGGFKDIYEILQIK
jgi:5'(3')-deoxyribonucleotidase